MSQVAFVINVPDHHDTSPTEYVHIGQELVRLVKLQHPHDAGITLAHIALGDSDTVGAHYPGDHGHPGTQAPSRQSAQRSAASVPDDVAHDSHRPGEAGEAAASPTAASPARSPRTRSY